VVENMSGFTCPSCGAVTHVFHQGGGEAIAQELGVAFLGKVPLDPGVVDCGDEGRPVIRAAPDSPAAQAYRAIAAALTPGEGGEGGIALPFDWDLAAGSGKPAAAPRAGSAQGPAERLVALDGDADALRPGWADGHDQRLASRDLRLACSCAQCRDEMTGKALLDPDRVPLDITITRIRSIGNYAISIAFSDGHDSGIYPFTALRAMQEAEVEDV